MYAICTCALLELVLGEPAYRKMMSEDPVRTQNPIRNQDLGPYREDPGPYRQIQDPEPFREEP